MSVVTRIGPWLPMVVGGVTIAVVVHLATAPREPLFVDAMRLRRIVEVEEDIRGAPLEAEERTAIRARLEDEEILLAEAERRGHLRQGYVYGRLLKKMRFLFTEAVTVPSDAELRAVYDAAPERFQRPGSTGFEDVVEQLRGMWIVERQRQTIARRTAELVSRYEVYVEGEQ